MAAIFLVFGHQMSKVYALAKQVKKLSQQRTAEVWYLEMLAIGKKVKTGGWQAWFTGNEYICSTLGTILGLPIPPFAMLEKRTSSGLESMWFASLDYRLAGEDMPEIHPPTVFSELDDVCLGIILFDLWIANTDRHTENLSFDPSASPKRLNVFDHTHALFRFEGTKRLKNQRDAFTLIETVEADAVRHCLIDCVIDGAGFGKWLDRIKRMPNFVIEDACQNAMEMRLIDENERAAAVDFLRYRRDKLYDILTANWRHFTSMKSTPMILTT